MHQIIDLQKEDSTTLAELAEWLLTQKAWEPLDYMEKRFTSQFESDAILIYTVAEAKLAQNDAAKAEELAAKALKLNPGSEYLAQHSVVAQYLKKRGCTAWAIKEYEYMIAHSGDQDYFALRSVMVLAEIYYDQGKNLEAGKTIEKFLKKPSVRRLRALGPSAEIPLDNALADMNYYFGCHWESQGDRKQQREFMEKALEADPTEINALIGYYHLPDLTPEEKQKVVGLIKRSADDARESIRLLRKQPVDLGESPSMVAKESSDCNQYAWLIANTEGDLDEALQFARRAVELEPQSGGIYDTLAHVYFAKGDYETAVKTERKAHELEPHSSMIQRKLELFEKTWESKK
jgi:tetratricopeptide (TPR) repeat protein